MKWLPRSIAGQMLALSLLAILAAHVVAVLVMTWWRADNETIHPLSVRTIETRVLSAYRAVGRAPDAQALLDDISLPDSRFEIADAPIANPPEMEAQGGRLAANLRRLLKLPDDLPVHAYLVPMDAGHAAGGNRNWLEKEFNTAGPPRALDIEVQMASGQWLRSRHWPTMLPAHWSRVLTFSLLVGMLPTALIALLFGRRIMRPLTLLTDASKRVSRGEHVVLPPPDGLSGVSDITKAFNEMQEKLIRFVNGRTQMIAAIGHDLRTPLTSLRIRAELIDDDGLRAAMIQTLDEMSVMVEETLKFARDDAHHEPTQDVPIADLVREVIDEQRIQGREVAWVSHVETSMLYRCRPVNVKRALNNVIDNAARYGDVCVQLVADTIHRTLRIEVEDQGPGIDPAHFERVFEPFSRLDSARNNATGGLGLGLAIARSCIRAHGGDITLHNMDCGGLRAIVELPT